MKKIYKFIVLALLLTSSFANANAQTHKYKCLVQMTNYMGEGAYIVISLVDSKGAYEKTLYVLGSDKKWYPDIKEWNKFYSKKPTNISATTGASVSGGDRSTHVLEIDDSKINKGYALRFESAVENKPYHVKDIEIPLTTENLSAKTEGDGKGYIRYVRLIPN
jgi:hypothetical protein